MLAKREVGTVRAHSAVALCDCYCGIQLIIRMGNSCSSSKGNYDTSTANPWLSVGSIEPPTVSTTLFRIPAVHAGSILGSANATITNIRSNS